MPTLTITTDQTDCLDDTIEYEYAVTSAVGGNAIRDAIAGQDFLHVVDQNGSEHCIRVMDIHKVSLS